MSRAVDVTLYRLVIVILVAVALIFSVILTSVFVDIEGLLVKESSKPSPKIALGVTELTDPYLNPESYEDSQALSSNEEARDNLASFRTKRSLESNKLIYQIKSPKIKKILTNHLATLLEELDEESLQTEKKVDVLREEYNVKPKDVIVEDKSEIDNKRDEINDNLTSLINKDVLHLAIHNIFHQGIIGHMDINDVYKKVHLLFKSLNRRINSDTKGTKDGEPKESTELMKTISQNSNNEENKIFEELLKCKKLQKQNNILQNQNETFKDPLIVIKTVVEINNGNVTDPPKNVKGLIKLVYNGKPIRVKDNAGNQNETISNTKDDFIEQILNQEKPETTTKTFETKIEKLDPTFNHAIEEYLRTHTFKLKNNQKLFNKEGFESTRLKRQIKIRYKDTTEKSKPIHKNPITNEDALYIEIETHLDGKGTKGEKKKKMVRSLIDKIQKAINSNFEKPENKAIPVQVKKRTQDPIKHMKEDLKVDTLGGLKTVEHRFLDPITKTVNVMQPLTSVLDKYGETWKRLYHGPGFITPTKSLNSAEMRELDVDYNSVLRNGIPKRLQSPINTENVNTNEDLEAGNFTLYLKEIGGSGFAIGISQYPDEPPDRENLQLFTNLENLIKTYHEHYDQPDATSNESGARTDINLNSREGYIESRHKRSVQNVKLFSNLKSKTKLSKFINTKVMKSKKIFLQRKRNKRHVDTVRIVASDHYPQYSKEDIFLVPHEDTFAERAIIKEDDVPEVEIGDKYEKHYDYIAPYGMNYKMSVPHFQPYVTSVYDTKSLQTELMAHYPHIFVENMSKSKEEFIDLKPFSREKLEPHEFLKSDSKTTLETTEDNEQIKSLPNVDEIVNAILPSRTNYKVTLKIFPKNKTDINPGYKEVHTTINKSYDKNGLRYVSSVNVSEVSKFESSNRTKDFARTKEITDDEIRNPQSQIKLLLKLHKQGIDHQLQHLKEESQKLKKIIGEGGKNIEINKITDLIEVFKEMGISNFDKINSTTERSTRDNDTITSKIEKKLLKHDDPVKDELIKTIEQNENLTKEILQRIDKNTNILQSFLHNLSEKVQSKAHIEITSEKPLFIEAVKSSHRQEHSLIEKIHSNFSHPIPFIYAFQPPITQNKEKPYKNVANVVYHGHIYANGGTYDKRNDFFKDIANSIKTPSSDNKKLSHNESRFFIDGIQNYFKPTPVLNTHPVPTAIKTNVTTSKVMK